jgi:hypothetical protein
MNHDAVYLSLHGVSPSHYIHAYRPEIRWACLYRGVIREQQAALD